MKHHMITLGMLIALAIPLFCLSPLTRELWLPDEPRYVQVAKEMTETGDWIIPHLNGQVYDQKPPLFFWLLAASAKLFGSWDTWAMTAPAALASIACLVVIYTGVTFVFNAKTGFLSALVLMTSVLFLGMGQMVRMDMLLLLCITVSLVCFYRLYIKTTTYDRIYALLFFVAAALGTLIKGPIGLGLPGLIIIVFVAYEHFFRHESERIVSVFKKMHVVWGSLLYAGIILAWFVPAIYRQGWDYAYLITIKQNLGRVHNSWSHPRPWYFYLYSFPWTSLPWFPCFLIAGFSKRMKPASLQEETAMRFLWIWWGVTFLFFTLISGKLEIYLLPLFPPMAVITGRFWATIETSISSTRRILKYAT